MRKIVIWEPASWESASVTLDGLVNTAKWLWEIQTLALSMYLFPKVVPPARTILNAVPLRRPESVLVASAFAKKDIPAPAAKLVSDLPVIAPVMIARLEAVVVL